MKTNFYNDKYINSVSIKNNKNHNILLNKEDVITGTIITKNDNSTTIKINEKLLSLKNNIDGNVGDEVSFKVVSNNNDSIVLKQIKKQENESARQAKILNIKDLFIKSNIIKEDENIFAEQSKTNENERACLQKLKRNITYNKNNLSQNIINQIVASGINLNKIDISMLQNVITQVSNTEPVKIADEQIAEQLNDYKDNNPTKRQLKIATELIKNSVPLTKSNLSSIETALDCCDDIQNLNSDKNFNLLKEEKPLTIENIFLYNFAQSNTKDITIDEDKIINLLNAIDVPINDENLEISKILIKNSVNINEDNINKYKFLASVNIDEVEVINQAIENIREDKNIYEIDLFNLKNKRQEISTLTSALKMASEASYRLANKSLNVETAHIKQLLEQITNDEAQKYQVALNIANVEVTADSLIKMHDITQKVSIFDNVGFMTYRNILFKEIPFTINSVSANKVNDIIENYNTFATTYNPKYGDSKDKVSHMIPEFLESINVQDCYLNRKAFNILSNNNIDITATNIFEVSVIDLKINQIHENLRPNIIAKMINEQVDPLNLHIDEVLDYISTYNDVYGATPKESLVNHIYELEKKNDLQNREQVIAVYRIMNQIQKNNSVGVGATLKNGQLPTLGNIFDGSKLYYKNQITDIKIDDNTQILQSQNLKSIIEKGIKQAEEQYNSEHSKSHSTFLDAFFDKTGLAKTKSNINLLNNIDFKSTSFFEANINTIQLDYISKNLTPDIANKICAENDFNNLTPNELAEKIYEIQSNQINDDIKYTWQNILKDDNGFYKIDAKHLKHLYDNKIDINLKNLKNIQQLDNSDILTNMIDTLELGDIVPNNFDMNNIENMLSTIDLSVDWDIVQTDKLKEMLYLQNKINKSDSNNYYSIPINIGDNVSNLNMYIVNDEFYTKNEISVLMDIKTQNIGNIKVNLIIRNNDLTIEYDADNELALSYLNKIDTFKQGEIITNKTKSQILEQLHDVINQVVINIDNTNSLFNSFLS